MVRGICGALVALLLARAVPAQAQDKPEWTFTVTPYAWLMGASGSVTAQRQTIDINAGITDIFGKTDTLLALMANLEARRDKLVLGLDVVFTQMVGSPGVAAQRNPVPWLSFSASAGANVKSTLVEIEGTAGYELAHLQPATAIDGFVGVRYWHAVTDMSFGFNATGSIQTPEGVGLFSRSIGIAGASTGSLDGPIRSSACSSGTRSHLIITCGCAVTSAASVWAANSPGRRWLPTPTNSAPARPRGRRSSAIGRSVSTTARAAATPSTWSCMGRCWA